LTGEFERYSAFTMSRELVMTIAAVVILSAAIGFAVAYPSHAYQTAATSGELATVHTYCMAVGGFEDVSPPWQVERWWPLRIGTVGAGALVALGLLSVAAGRYTRRLRPVLA
jgi:hypothetical protein